MKNMHSVMKKPHSVFLPKTPCYCVSSFKAHYKWGFSMAIKTTLEQLEEVQSAISAVMSSQSYTVTGQSVTKNKLKREYFGRGINSENEVKERDASITLRPYSY